MPQTIRSEIAAMPEEAWMLELPNAMRTLLAEQLEDYCEKLDDTSDTDAIAEAVVETIETVGQELVAIDAEEIISQLEASGELEASLLEVIEDALASDPGFGYTAEEIITLLEKLCEIEWLDEDEDDDAGYFADGVDQDDEY